MAEIKQSKFYSVLANEVAVTTLNNYRSAFDLWTVKVLFVKHFKTFLKLNRVRAVDIADVIVKYLENLCLSLSELRSQGYDGASTMSGHKSGMGKVMMVCLQ